MTSADLKRQNGPPSPSVQLARPASGTGHRTHQSYALAHPQAHRPPSIPTRPRSGMGTRNSISGEVVDSPGLINPYPLRPPSVVHNHPNYEDAPLAPPNPPFAHSGSGSGSTSSGGSGSRGSRTWSYEALPGLKTYPVLQLPGRETHDRYDDGWGVSGLDELLNGKKSVVKEGESNAQGFTANSPAVRPTPQRPASAHRKKLFYFDGE